MAQNIYDDPKFLEGYRTLPRSVDGLDGAPEWPDVRKLLPDLAGTRVVDLGCGFGWFSRFAAEAGAASVLGLDISAQMLERARTETASEAVSYAIADLDWLELAEGSVDLAYSSLAFHYVEDFDRLATTVSRALAPGGTLVFTIEHPVFMASVDARWNERADGAPFWPVDHYFDESERVTRWFVDGVVKHHRTLSTTLMALIDAGLVVDHVEEWRPTAEQIEANPDWSRELHRPMFLIVRGRKR